MLLIYTSARSEKLFLLINLIFILNETAIIHRKKNIIEFHFEN